MRVMMIAGEPSGDLHGAGVVGELKRTDPAIEIYGIGGDKMQAAGMQLVYHIRELSVMGFVEVIRHLPLLRSVKHSLGAMLRVRKPDVVVLIDYPGFNLRFARLVAGYGIPVLYYISPQVWAWNPGRVKKMRGIIRKMLVVFPFEVDIYRKQGIDVEFVGHPLLDEVDEPLDRAAFCKRFGLDTTKLIVALLPGSRSQEIQELFLGMLAAVRSARESVEFQVVVGVAPTLDIQILKSFIGEDSSITLIRHATHDVMKNADLAVVTSGTATLETGLFRTPMIVVYKTSWITYLIGRLLVRIKNIGLVNIVAGETIVPELVQSSANPRRMSEEILRFLGNSELRSQTRDRLAVIRSLLGAPGAARLVARAIVETGAPR